MTATCDAIVVGGGLHGLSAALQLARRGLQVTLLERSWIGRHSSGSSAAGVRTMGRARAELPASLSAMAMWHDIASLVGDCCGFEANGQVKAIETEEEFAKQAALVELLRRDGYTHEEMIGAAELREIVPAISRHCVGARIARRDGAADPHRTLKAFLRSATEAGVSVFEGLGVTGVRRRQGVWIVSAGDANVEAPFLVNAAGAWGGQVAAMAGDTIPLARTKASMMIVTERVAPFVRPTVTAAGRTLSFKQTSQGTVLIGGGAQGHADLETETSRVDALALAKSAAAAVAIFPSVAGIRIVRTWAGIEASSVDGVAIAGLSPNNPGLMHLFGFTGHGFQLVPALGVATAELLLDGSSSIDVTGLRPERLMDGPARRPDCSSSKSKAKAVSQHMPSARLHRPKT